MKLIIDIDEDIYNHIVVDSEYFTPSLVNAFKNGTPIPDNDCNNCEKAWTDKCERAECYENNYKHWTPYQKGGKK